MILLEFPDLVDPRLLFDPESENLLFSAKMCARDFDLVLSLLKLWIFPFGKNLKLFLDWNFALIILSESLLELWIIKVFSEFLLIECSFLCRVLLKILSSKARLLLSVPIRYETSNRLLSAGLFVFWTSFFLSNIPS